MTCPQCGTPAPALARRCPVCGCQLMPKTKVATSVLTPTPIGTSDTDLTRLATPEDSDVTRLASPTDTPRPPTPPVTPQTTTGGRTSGPQSGPLMVGQNFGSRYHIIRLLGIGGMGAVYQAWDQVLEVAVAIKVIRPTSRPIPQEAADLESRFKRELLLARQVTHKNVVRIHDIGEIDGITYITMPYVQGSDLSTILKREGRLPVAGALAIARQVALGLDRRARRRRRPSRSQAREHHGRRGGPRAHHGLRHRAIDAGHGVAMTVGGAGRSARSSTCRPSRREARRSISAPTSTRSG